MPALFMTMTVSSWRCHCSASIKVVSELDRDHPYDTREVTCPHCGDEQKVYAHKVISVTAEMAASVSGYF